MSKNAVIALTLVMIGLVVGIPLWAVSKDTGPGSAVTAVADKDEAAQVVFQENCGPCHTMKKAGTDGVVGPNLDASGAASSAESVRGFIENGSQGRMPAGILTGERAQEVAEFVAGYAGQ